MFLNKTLRLQFCIWKYILLGFLVVILKLRQNWVICFCSRWCLCCVHTSLYSLNGKDRWKKTWTSLSPNVMKSDSILIVSLAAISTDGYCHRSLCPSALPSICLLVCPSVCIMLWVCSCWTMSVPNDVTALTLWGFQLLAWNLVGWCTETWIRLLLKMVMLGQFLHIPQNFEISRIG